ncbi:MAG: hypothetical protein EZS28_049225 [Streblomastix strix]|uniref:Uncharacterized protein n=1 Tax=Streblomastix strix TaxID=222440 RepID=A0A5J4TAG1_9EUKA|nr:MAG: hypothetical protein EZS28_049225 [Streblomastix strix]
MQVGQKSKKIGRSGNDYNISQPALSLSYIEQVEKEGGNEEIESLLINKENGWNIKDSTNKTKDEILNCYIDINNKRPRWYYQGV